MFRVVISLLLIFPLQLSFSQEAWSGKTIKGTSKTAKRNSSKKRLKKSPSKTSKKRARVKGGNFVKKVTLNLSMMDSEAALSEGDFYLNFPTLNRRGPRSLRRGNEGLQLSFHLANERTQTFEWDLASEISSQAAFVKCPRGRCPEIHFATQNIDPFEIRSESRCEEANPVGIREAHVTYTLNNGEQRYDRLENLWIPCTEISNSDVSEIRMTIKTGDRGGAGTSGNGVHFQLHLADESGLVRTKLPFDPRGSISSGEETTFVWRFMEIFSEYADWRDTRSETFRNAVQRGACLAQNRWNMESDCSRENYEAWYDDDLIYTKYCETTYDRRCRYQPLTIFDPSAISIHVIPPEGDRDEAPDPWFVDAVDLDFEYANGDVNTLNLNSQHWLPCHASSFCELSASPQRAPAYELVQVEWEIHGNANDIEFELDCDGGEADTSSSSTYCGLRDFDTSFTIRSRWGCDEAEPNERRVGLTYENWGLDTVGTRCTETVEVDSLPVVNVDGCSYPVLSPIMSFQPFGQETRDRYFNDMGMRENDWEDYGLNHPNNSLLPLKRVYNALNFLETREWNVPNVFGGLRNAHFYDHVSENTNRLRLPDGCELLNWDNVVVGLNLEHSGDIKIAKRLTFQNALKVSLVLVHEAQHTASSVHHVRCTDSSESSGGCDPDYPSQGAYGKGARFLKYIVEYCTNCSPVVKERARHSGNLSLDSSFVIDPGFRL